MLTNNQENTSICINHCRRCTCHPTQQRETCGLSFRQFPLVLMLKLPENNKKNNNNVVLMPELPENNNSNNNIVLMLELPENLTYVGIRTSVTVRLVFYGNSFMQN